MYSPEICKLFIKNSNEFHKKKALPKAEALKFTAQWFIEKFPKLKKELSKKCPYDPSRRVADALAYDRQMWAMQNKAYINS